MREFYSDAKLGEMKEALRLYNDEEFINVELTGDWYSYRGYYDQVAIEYKRGGKDLSTVKDLTDVIEDALAAVEMTGYKGGQFSINENTVFCFCTAPNFTGGLYPASVSRDFDGVRIIVKDDE